MSTTSHIREEEEEEENNKRNKQEGNKKKNTIAEVSRTRPSDWRIECQTKLAQQCEKKEDEKGKKMEPTRLDVLHNGRANALQGECLTKKK